ncbi:MAG: 1-acyl-sn-glycerol-3-phosphate acyltransferase [Bacteroidia bacterium]|nr:1-acyl-sn-glycerol-3-phosphate acyltransferase [Bacteroidia bacterium]
MGNFPLSFDEIRAYYDTEVPEVMLRITQKPSFQALMPHLLPDIPLPEVEAGFRSVTSTWDFQRKYIHKAIRSIISDSTAGLSCEGLEYVTPETPRLFLSNHRDIILDSAFLNVLLFEHQVPTSHIAIGDNLLVSPIVSDLMRLNKSFIVHREAPRHLMLAYSERLGRYIRHIITEVKESVWLAHRNGRSKEGIDQTHTGLLKMLTLGGPDSLADNFNQLSICPMAISYEYEPCDWLKAEEKVYHYKNIPYLKDDKMAMVRGIRDPKGRVHLAIGAPLHLREEDVTCHPTRNDFLRWLAAELDMRIWQYYRKWPTHYIAHDLLHHTQAYAEQYTPDEKNAFEAHLEMRVTSCPDHRDEIRTQILKLYANALSAPV